MPTPTYTPLYSTTLAASAASVEIPNIPQTYRDLVITIAGTTTGNANLLVRFNGDSAGNYSDVTMRGDGSSPYSNTDSAAAGIQITTQSTFSTAQGNVLISVMDYSATDKHKSVLARGNNAGLGVDAAAGRWASTSTITSVMFYLSNANSFATGTTLALYGIASA